MAAHPIFALGALLLGAILGSFLNALTFRYNTGARLWRAMGGRSHCMRCGHVLSASDLVPIFSWLALRGRCRYCRSPISMQYPLVEFCAALLSLGIYELYPYPLPYAFWVLVWMTLLFLIVYDWRHMILPLEGIALVGVLAFASLFFSCGNYCMVNVPDWLQVLSGALLALPLLSLSFVSRGRWMGWGDGLLAFPLGWILGMAGGFTALALAFWMGAAAGIALIVVSKMGSRRGITLKTAIPFGPFLALGAAAVFFTQLNLFTLFGW